VAQSQRRPAVWRSQGWDPLTRWISVVCEESHSGPGFGLQYRRRAAYAGHRRTSSAGETLVPVGWWLRFCEETLARNTIGGGEDLW